MFLSFLVELCNELLGALGAGVLRTDDNRKNLQSQRAGKHELQLNRMSAEVISSFFLN